MASVSAQKMRLQILQILVMIIVMVVTTAVEGLLVDPSLHQTLADQTFSKTQKSLIPSVPH